MGKFQKNHVLSGSAGAWLWDAVKGKKRYVALQTLLQALVGLGCICYSLLFREMIDRAVDKDRPGFFRFLVFLVLMALLRILLRAFVRRMDEFISAVVENSLKRRMFANLLSRDYAGVTAVHSAQWMNRLTSDTVVVAKAVAQIIPSVGGMAVQLLGAVGSILILAPAFGLVIIPGGLALILIGRFLRPAMKRLHGKIQETDGDVRVLMQERLDNLLIVSAYSVQGQSVDAAKERMRLHKDARMKRNFMTNLNQVGLGIAMQGMYLMGAGFCAWGILNGTVSYGTMTAILQMIGYLQQPFVGFGGYFNQWFSMMSSAERIMEAEALAADPAAQSSDPAASLALYNSTFLGFRLDDLRFSYVDRSEGKDLAVSLHYPNLEISRGHFISLAGRSGCGKSTLLKLLMGIYSPDSGRILLTEGENTRAVTGADRGLFAYVPQGNMLMSGTIREIVAFYDRKAMKREEQLWQSLRISCAEGFVRELPQGLDTLLGEHGAGLSEGQIQRIAVARAIFSGRPVLLLDEATSALDEQTEAQLLDNLKTMTDKTVLIVTHRPRACEICDRVIYLDNHTEGVCNDRDE